MAHAWTIAKRLGAVFVVALVIGCASVHQPVTVAPKPTGPIVAQYDLYGSASEPILLLLEADANGHTTVTALVTRKSHETYFTTRPPTYLTLRGIEYVPARTFFNQSLPAILKPTGSNREYELKVIGESQARCEDSALIELLGRSTAATFEFTSVLRGRDQEVRFDRDDFARRSRPAAPIFAQHVDDSDAACLGMVRASLSDAESSQYDGLPFRVLANPKGRGKYVYIAGSAPLWFVLDGQSYVLNGPAIRASPKSPKPVDRPTADWSSTGLAAMDVTYASFVEAGGETH